MKILNDLQGNGGIMKKLASDALGLSDIGAILSPNQYEESDSYGFIRRNNGEEIKTIIKSKTDEYCFTNEALIHVDGTSAVSKKRTVSRYPYWQNRITGVKMETAGTVDLDAEIKFTLGQNHYSIDVQKKQLSELVNLYNALNLIEETMMENSALWEYADSSLETATAIATKSFQRVDANNFDLSETFQKLTENSFQWKISNREKYQVKDFGFAFNN